MGRLSPEEELTIASYEKIADQWAEAYSDEKFWGKEIQLFHRLLPDGKVLDVGVGGGRDFGPLSKMGYQYFGVDRTFGFLRYAMRSRGELAISQQNIYSLAFEDGTFDGFWASAVLLHIDPEQLDEALAELRRITKNCGIGFISVKEGVGSEIVGEPNLPRKFYYYQLEEFAAILRRNGLLIVDTIIKPGTKHRWLSYFVRVSKTC